MSDANRRTQCARLFDGSGLGWRCTRPIGHQGQHCSSSFMPGIAADGSAEYILTRYQGSTERTPLTGVEVLVRGGQTTLTKANGVFA